MRKIRGDDASVIGQKADAGKSGWFRLRTEGPSGARKTTMIVALARKLLIALWRLVTVGEVPEGVVLRPAV
jgi:transposase